MDNITFDYVYQKLRQRYSSFLEFDRTKYVPNEYSVKLRELKTRLEKLEQNIMGGIKFELKVYRVKNPERKNPSDTSPTAYTYYGFDMNEKKKLGTKNGWEVFILGNTIIRTKRGEIDILRNLEDYLEAIQDFDKEIKELNPKLIKYFEPLIGWKSMTKLDKITNFQDSFETKIKKAEKILEHNTEILKKWEHVGDVIGSLLSNNNKINE